MSDFPSDYDDDTTLPVVNDDITEIGAEAINALRDAVFNIEQNIGLNAQGSAPSVAERISLSLNPDGTIKPSAIASLGLITLPITQDQISPTADIPESKLHLDHRTQDLYNYIQDLSGGVNDAMGWISITGSKLDPHLLGAIYRHVLSQIDVSTSSADYLRNKFRLLRDNTSAYTLIDDINQELLAHQWADGSIFGTITDVVTNDGSTYPSNYAHTAGGIFLNTSRFSVIPQTAQDLQQFAEFIDSSSIFLYGSRIQNLYSNGVSKVSRSSSLAADGYGLPIVPPTSAIAYLLNTGSASAPVDDISTGDDIIEFKPSTADMNSNSFDAKFALVKPGDIVRINYGTIEVQFIIKEKKYIQSGGNKKYIVRIAGKNLFYSATASARIDRSLVNDNKFGVLGIAAANNSFAQQPSLIVGSPSGAQALGLGFNPDQFDSTHYLLYLAIYPSGHPEDGYTILPAIDVTGNGGTTPGLYTLSSVVQATNNAFRRSGFNYRFIAFSYQGEFGIMLADSYNNAGFSILNAVVSPDGSYDEGATNIVFQHNAIGMFAAANAVAPDPLGFGPLKSGLSSPPYMTTYGSPEAALSPTKLFLPLNRNNYYVNGTEKDRLALDVEQVLDGYGDGYWVATVTTQNVFPGANGHIQTTYRVNSDLSTSNLKVGKTLVVQSVGSGSLVDFGRFTIQNIDFGCCPAGYTDITVYDSVHATGISPSAVLPLNSQVGLYFNYDSVSFNLESATDFTPVAPFKRYFEVFADSDGKTFTHERARINASASTIVVNSVPVYTYSELNKLDIVRISPKLQGYQFGSVSKITLSISSYDSATGLYDGYLASYNGTNLTKIGQTVTGKKGEVTRFYNETNIDYIDILFDVNTVVNDFSDQVIDFQLFPTLSLDDQIMILASCQLNDVSNVVSNITDERQFGNTSEKDLSTSVLNLISLPEKLLHDNGVVRGFDLDSSTFNPNQNQFFLQGGVAVVNGKIIQVNNQAVNIPYVRELNGSLWNINWAVCVNDKAELQIIPLLDYDPIVPTPTNVARVFRAFDVISSALYYLDAVTFTDLISNRQNLTILYVVTSQVTSTPTISLTVYDARKFVNSETSNIPFTFVPNDSTLPGHFRSFESVITWINKFGADNNTVIVRGIHTIDEEVLLVNMLYPVTFKGENAQINVTSINGLTVNKNVTIKDISFNYNPVDFPVTGNGLINGDSGCIVGESGYGGVAVNITVDNCHFTSGTNNHPPFICFRVHEEQYIDGVRVTNNRFSDTNSVHDAAIAFINTFEGISYTFVPTIANVLVENNICEQSQGIYVVSAYTAETGKFGFPGLGAVNVSIINNVAGYIGYSISSNSNLNTNIKGTSLVSLLIENNTVIAILNTISTDGGFARNFSCPFGNVIITKNKANFIQVGSSTDGYGKSSLDISHNTLTAADFSILIVAVFGSGGFISESSAILVHNFNNVGYTISNVSYNNILEGRVGSTIYRYQHGIHVESVIVSVTNNNISGLIDGGTTTFGIYAVNFSGKINDNIITRAGVSIRSYIAASGLGPSGEVIGNFLDSSYVDAGNTDYASAILSSDSVVVSRNRNHINTTTVRVRDVGKLLINSDSGTLYDAYYDNALVGRPVSEPTDGSPGALVGFKLTFFAGSGSNFYWNVDLREILPLEAKIVSASIGGTVEVGTQWTTAAFYVSIYNREVYPTSDPLNGTPGFYSFNTANPGIDSSTITTTASTNTKIINKPYIVVRLFGDTASGDRLIYLTALTVRYMF